MALLKIITLPKYEKELRQPSLEIKATDIKQAKMQSFFNALGETMIKADGLGLAAPQTNRHIRVIAVNINEQPQIFINPQIVSKSWSKNIMEEGCLSIPNVYGPVKRSKKITLTYYDRHGQLHKEKFTGLPARVIQHEVDHLDGVLFIDKLVK